MIRTKRAYERPSPSDGERILIDRLWPRGVSKEAARIDRWEVELAPSRELRVWFGHDPEKFPQFRERYRMELLRRRDALAELAVRAEKGTVTLVYAARDPERCNATVLKELLEEVLEPRATKRGRSPGDLEVARGSRTRAPPAVSGRTA